MESTLNNPFLIAIGIVFLIVFFRSIVVVPENERRAVVRLGRYLRTLGPGVSVIIPSIDTVKRVNLDADFPGWQAMTEAQLAEAIGNFVTFGTVKPSKGAGNKPFFVEGAKEQQAVATWLVEAASQQTGVDLSQDQVARSRLIETAQKAIEQLANGTAYEVNLPYIAADRQGPKHFSCTFTRAQLQKILNKRPE